VRARILLVVMLVLPSSGACSSSAGVPGGADGPQGQDSGPPSGDAGAPLGDAAVPIATDASGGTDASTTFDAHPADASDAHSLPAPDATTPDAGADVGVANGPWSPVSYGVTTKDANAGADIVIAYGGYTATDADSQAWVTQMTIVRLAQLGVGHMYAVRGPKDADYASREIGNSELAAALATQTSAATHVIVIAHSSGGFVADELFTFADASVLSKVAYFNLDGGSWALTDALVGSMRGVYFCNAHDAVAGDSENTSSDQSLHAAFPASHYFTVDADGSGCDVGAGWCLHDTLIINHPHDPTTFDLALDYTDFTSGRQVVTSYVDQAVSDGVL
jgi:hypothetical protein